jgi:zinc and cadmium transporter
MVFELIMGSALLIAFLSLSGIVTLAMKEDKLNKMLLLFVGLSAGTFIGGAFLELIPESVERISGLTPYLLVITGFILFYILERFLYWRHCHEDHCEEHQFTYLNLIGDTIHNFEDGMAIAVSFLTDVPLGIATTIAVAAHEIPQEIGDFGVLLYGGFSKRKAMAYNFLAALTIVPGAIAGYLLFQVAQSIAAYILPLAAGGFIYIAATDLIPEIKKEGDGKKSIAIFAMFLLGIGIMLATKLIFE